jgi:predicted ATPase
MPRPRRHPQALPSPLEPLFGRDEICARVVEMLEREPRAVTLTGPGGIGKSRLAHEVARAFGPSRRVHTCELADAPDLEALLRAIARATGTQSGRERGGAAVRAMAGKLAAHGDTLVVLDNADTVVAPCAILVRACLEAGTQTRFIVTSREPLGIDGERVVEVPALSTEAARAMFEARADGDRSTEEDLGPLIEQLDGLPLAIELAARRARVLPPRELLSRLDERFRLLKSDRRDLAKRHVTLAATLDWSWDRLTADERSAFVGLGLFEGGIPVEAFEAVVAPLLSGDPLDVAQSLLRKSLITSVDSPGAARLSMLVTLRAFARSRTTEVAGWDAAEDRHARFYLDRAEKMAARAYGASAESALDALEADLPNLLVAFARARTRAPAHAARVVVALGDLVLLRNVIDLRSSRFAEARAAADAGVDVELRVRARIVEAKVMLEIGAATDAEMLLVGALSLAEGALVVDVQADVQRSLGWARLALGRTAEALDALENALRRYDATDSPVSPLRGNHLAEVRGRADALAARGLVHCLQGALADGHRDLECAYAAHVLANDSIRRDKVVEMAHLVGLELGGGDDGASLEPQIARLRASAEAHRSSGRLWREAIDRFRLATIESSPEARQTHLEMAREAAAATGVSSAIAKALESAKSVATHMRPVEKPWIVGPEGRWLRTPNGERIDLTRHGSLRRVLDALVMRRLEAPGMASTASTLLELGWPGERPRHESGMLRVYTAIRRLRALGLEGVLITHDDGYLLDPVAGVERAR